MSEVVGKVSTQQLAILALLLLAASLISQQFTTSGNSATYYEEVVQARNYVLRALPQLKNFLATEPVINNLGVDKALNLSIIKIVWNLSKGLYVEVSEVRINTSWIPYYLYVELNHSNSSLAKSLSSESSGMISSLRNRYYELANQISESGLKIIGFAIYVNSTPIGVLRPGPYIDIARIYWGVRFEGPISAYALLNDYPIIKYFLKKRTHLQSLKVKDVVKKLNKVSITQLKESDIRKYLIIVNGSLIQAYVAYLNPYEIGVVLGGKGELIYPGNYTSPAVNSSLQNEASNKSNQLMSHIFYMFIIITVVISVVIIVWLKLRRV